MDEKVRHEHDSLGAVDVPAGRYWGAQTQRALQHFPAGRARFCWGRPVIRALGIVKLAAAQTNGELGLLTPARARFIAAAATEVMAGRLDAEFPLAVFQSGSGTQTNMNANEVIANRANELAGSALGSNSPIHPNDHVNLCQSTNDVFPTVMHIASVEEITHRLMPAVEALRRTLQDWAGAQDGVVMLGRTHLQDATPVTLAQVSGGWVGQLDHALAALEASFEGLHGLALGGTAVGTGLNAHPRFAERAIARIGDLSGLPFRSAEDLFAALSAHDAIMTASGALRTLSAALMKIANDVRWYASGPRGGIAELLIPANEPGSSIMPGKVNPTQAEALTQIVTQVYGNDATIAFAGSQGAFQLNVYKPVMLHNLLESIDLLADGIAAFDHFCASGLQPNLPVIRRHLDDSLMLATALAPHIGYDRAASIALRALREGLSLREAALGPGGITAEQFDAWVQPEAMTGSGRGDEAAAE